jgi:hypothetical protein
VNVVAARAWSVDLAGDGLRLGNLFRFEALAFEHVHEIGVAAEIELIGAIEPHAAFAEQIGENAMRDGGADLRFDVVADDRQPRSSKRRPSFGSTR